MLRACIDRCKGFSEPSGHPRLLAGVCVVLLLSVAASQTELLAQRGGGRRTLRYESVTRPQIRLVQNSKPSASQRPLPSPIRSMPTVQEEMQVIHHRSQLVVAKSNIVRTAIADPSVVDVVQYSPNEISVIGLGLGSTTLTMWFENNPQPLIYLVQIIRDPSIEERKRIDYGKLERKLAVLFPNSKVYLIPLSRKIIVKGQARDAAEAARILSIVRGEMINQDGSLAGPQPNATPGLQQGINPFGLASTYVVNMLEVPGEFQVMLRVRIAELNRSQLRRMGVDLRYLINDGRHVLSTAMGGVPSTLAGIFENGEINVLMNWLANNGTTKILAEPTLTVISGHTASFLSGGEFAVPTIVGVGGAQGTTTTFRGFGTSLIVTPTVLDKDLIRMRIIPEFSQINNENTVQGIPGINSRRVQTTVELREGQTIVLAGLLSRQTRTDVTRIPFLGEIPFIGRILFNAKEATEDETELLILVTPELVRPMDAEEVPPVPGFYVTHPNDEELFRHAMTEGAPDTGVYQLAPYGRGWGHGIDVGYRLFNPAPASRLYAPIPVESGFAPPHQQPFDRPPAHQRPGLRTPPPMPTPISPSELLEQTQRSTRPASNRSVSFPRPAPPASPPELKSHDASKLQPNGGGTAHKFQFDTRPERGLSFGSGSGGLQ